MPCRPYATLPVGADKQQALFELCRCFHPYLMKYLSMICRGHVPQYQGYVNKDARKFVRYFVSKNVPVALSQAVANDYSNFERTVGGGPGRARIPA